MGPILDNTRKPSARRGLWLLGAVGLVLATVGRAGAAPEDTTDIHAVVVSADWTKVTAQHIDVSSSRCGSPTWVTPTQSVVELAAARSDDLGCVHIIARDDGTYDGRTLLVVNVDATRSITVRNSEGHTELAHGADKKLAPLGTLTLYGAAGRFVQVAASAHNEP